MHWVFSLILSMTRCVCVGVTFKTLFLDADSIGLWKTPEYSTCNIPSTKYVFSSSTVSVLY
jgi:hypothetical protein